MLPESVRPNQGSAISPFNIVQSFFEHLLPHMIFSDFKHSHSDCSRGMPVESPGMAARNARPMALIQQYITLRLSRFPQIYLKKWIYSRPIYIYIALSIVAILKTVLIIFMHISNYYRFERYHVIVQLLTLRMSKKLPLKAF